MPPEVVAKLNDAMVKVLKDPAVVKRFADLTAEAYPTTPQETAAMFDAEDKHGRAADQEARHQTGVTRSMTWLPPTITPIVLLLISNVFMTFAWYGHLKFTDRPLWLVVVASWGIAFIEYCFAVPANRWGHTVYSAAELKTMQEVITLTVFAVFSVPLSRRALHAQPPVGFAPDLRRRLLRLQGPDSDLGERRAIW